MFRANACLLLYKEVDFWPDAKDRPPSLARIRQCFEGRGPATF